MLPLNSILVKKKYQSWGHIMTDNHLHDNWATWSTKESLCNQ